MNYRFPDIDRLISLYLSHRASESERKELEEWLHASKANQEVFGHLKKVWSMSSQGNYHTGMDRVRDQIWKYGIGHQHRIKVPVQRTVDVCYWSKLAATFLIFLLGAWLFTYLNKEGNGLLPDTAALVERENRAGQRSIHMLPDGTQVWLNAESSLVYPEKFTGTLRMVQLKGEAFFKVAKDQQKPFIVEAAGTKTLALGTAFNIHAYPENDIKIALLEGKVQVQNVGQWAAVPGLPVRFQTAILSPGEELVVYKDNSDFDRGPFNYESVFGWKEGILFFDGVDFACFRSSIEKWYGVKVTVKGTPPADWHIRARYQHEDLRHVLRDICFNKDIKFKLEDKNVQITF